MAKSYFGIEVPDLYEKWDKCNEEAKKIEKRDEINSLDISSFIESSKIGSQLNEKMARVYKLCVIMASRDMSFHSKHDEYMKLLAKELLEIADLQKELFDFTQGPDENIDKMISLLSEGLSNKSHYGQDQVKKGQEAIEKIKKMPKEDARKIIGSSAIFFPVIAGINYSACTTIAEDADETINIEEDYQNALKYSRDVSLENAEEHKLYGQVFENTRILARDLVTSKSKKIGYTCILEEIRNVAYHKDQETNAPKKK